MEKFIGIFFLLKISLFFFSVPKCWVKLTGSTRLWYPVVKLFRYLFAAYPKSIYVIPSCLLILSWFVAVHNRTMDEALAAATILYLFVPTSFAWSLGHRRSKNYKKPGWVDFMVILMLWLPLEYGASNGFLKNYFGELAHVLPWGTGVIMALFIFLVFRCLDGMKLVLPHSNEDIFRPVVGFVVSAIVLIPLGLTTDFLGDFKGQLILKSTAGLLTVAGRFFRILAGVALPEEILFRSLIQNWMTQKFGASNFVIFCSALIFGASHLNNGGWPNWRYAIIATIAGFIYGKVFQKANSVFASAGLHAAVNTVRHSFFG